MTEISNLNGKGWWEVPAPPADHECWAQTAGSTELLPFVQRCPCGAIRRWPSGAWLEKNSRRGEV